MPESFLGNAWLQERYSLYSYTLTHISVTGTRLRKDNEEFGQVKETYPPNYFPGERPMDHIEFALKYDDLNLDFLKAVFKRIKQEEVVEYIYERPKGAYQRRIGFLYEFLTGQQLVIPSLSKGNYINLLDEEKYVTGKEIKEQRWLINDNLLGPPSFCPIIRKTQGMQNVFEEDYQQMIAQIKKSFPPDIFHRAVNYLYTKETRSSYQIEQEVPTQERVNRFVRLLEKVAEEPTVDLLSEPHLTRLQNEIVDHRYAASGFRNFQNYIGQTSFNYKQIIHYVCPPPEIVSSLMDGLSHAAMRTKAVNAIVRATVTAFGFVFIHPFEDGNGRLHRFLIHDMLTRENVVPKGMIIPVSAHMVNHINEYNKVLECYSKPLLERVQYELDEQHSMKITNSEVVEGYFRYPDLTAQCIYLGAIIKGSIQEDIYLEMEFLVHYDEAKLAIKNIVDMPDKEIDLFIKFMHQNRGNFPVRRRKQFDKLTDKEISQMEQVFSEIFNIPRGNDDV
jgi:fido (protein-threonine AMPylation protein)